MKNHSQYFTQLVESLYVFTERSEVRAAARATVHYYYLVTMSGTYWIHTNVIRLLKGMYYTSAKCTSSAGATKYLSNPLKDVWSSSNSQAYSSKLLLFVIAHQF